MFSNKRGRVTLKDSRKYGRIAGAGSRENRGTVALSGQEIIHVLILVNIEVIEGLPVWAVALSPYSSIKWTGRRSIHAQRDRTIALRTQGCHLSEMRGTRLVEIG